MKHLSNDHKECFNQHKNSHKLFNKIGHPVVNLMENQWKLRQIWSEVPNGGEVTVEQILASEERKKSKRAGLW